jgi:hypothetical protein
VTLGDLNDDGNDDVITGDQLVGLSVFLANGDGTLAARTPYSFGFSPRAEATGDVNGDTHLDVVVATGGVGSGVSLLLGNGDGTLGPATSVWTVSGGSQTVVLADVNGDTFLDLLTLDPSPDRIDVLLGDGAGGFSLHGFISAVVQGGPRSLAVVDLDGDTHLDVVALDSLSGGVRIALGNGDGSFGAVSSFSGGSRPFSVAAGDLNGDAIPDLAVANAFAMTPVFLGNGDGTFTLSQGFGGESISVLMADLNHDALLDMAIASRTTTQTVPDFVRVLVNTTNLAMERPVANCAEAEATVSWTAPVGASAVTGYVVTPYIGYTPEPSITFNSTATTQTITGLSDGTEYRFKVAARNAVGVGSFSKVSNPVTPAPAPSVPDSPKLPKATAGNAQATVSWNPPSNGCSPLTGYVITPYFGYWALPSTTFNSTETTQTVTGLTNGTQYRFRIRAINAIGTGAYSKVTNPVIPTA